MFKNTASQKIALFAFDVTTGLPKSGDSANITAYVSKDWGTVTVLGDTSATEMESTNAKGWYLFDLTQAETNADALLFTGKSSTTNIAVVGMTVFTVLAANDSADALLDRAAGVETNRTLRQSLRLMLAALAGKASGLASTSATFRDTNDSVNRIVATVDADGNRTAVTLDAS